MMRSRDLIYRFVLHLGQQVQVFANNLYPPGARRLSGFADRIAASQKVAPFSADRQNVDVLIGKNLQELGRYLQHVGVERACQSAIAGHQHQQDVAAPDAPPAADASATR